VSHLGLWELACHDHARTPYPRKWHRTRLRALRRAFEAIRHACGDRPIRVLSAYRTSTHNRQVGGARRSQHVAGRALDLRPPVGMTVPQFATIIDDLLDGKTTAIRGRGRYRWFVHIDVRPGTRLARWSHLGPGSVKV
jgi:uncharacterized protein YcbK (DUF882 family)